MSRTFSMESPARRVTVYKAHDGWRFRVQAKNWRIIAASEQGRSKKSRVLAIVEQQYPGVELVVVP